MPKIPSASGVKVRTGQTVLVREYADVEFKDTPYYGLMLLVAECLDEAARGHNCYMVIGTTQARDQISVVVNLDGSKAASYGSDLDEVANRTVDLLSQAP